MIPKLLHKIWLGPRPDTLNFSDKWLDYFPDYQLKVWDNVALEPYFDKMVEYIGEVPKCNFTSASDILRLLIIRDHGGIYLDHDIEIIKSFTHLFNDSQTYLTFQYPESDNPPEYKLGVTMRQVLMAGGDSGKTNTKFYKDETNSIININKSDYVNNCFIASIPNSLLVDKALEIYKENYYREPNNKFPLSDWSSGPGTLTRAAEQFGIQLNGKTQTNEHVTVFERSLLHPIHGIERYSEKDFDLRLINARQTAFAIHHHVFTNMKRYIESMYESENNFNSQIHSFTLWLTNEYKKFKS